VDQSLWIGDVGQSDREEVDHVAVNAVGRNFGWDCREGNLDTTAQYGGTYCAARTFAVPVQEYDHSLGCSITGGYRYRGQQFPSMAGMYLYADYCSGRVWAYAPQTSGGAINAQVYQHSTSVPTFGESQTGELYAADTGGGLYHVVASAR
ncbi:MAG: PQQ-dependent sugar dehydrogenase, partial [Frankia sp.]|nr:PQQ-dependent sugar dehydrogenase [Frankia sp.]